jgi:hypothetical protein
MVRRVRGHAHRSPDRFCGGRRRRACGRHIGQLTDANASVGCHDPVVVITIRLDAIDPPAGRVSLAGQEELVFVGWLGLLRALSELLASVDQ